MLGSKRTLIQGTEIQMAICIKQREPSENPDFKLQMNYNPGSSIIKDPNSNLQRSSCDKQKPRFQSEMGQVQRR